ncbi:hypothetical protein [Thiomicrorhabdus lithotrophica]|uniref:Uncharacterized protein n=1 Tax=Thiomicrorhabdus lithotrophica TaxID=2949997 RepID=A0ABY8C6K4_9GAMM|nr:hypothetical protein [Thiomicrorhabdus lithotrophica]WEJ61600.1 hypothetical protein NR989_06175 [Thiomicrorhabdus lithotrophica]
MASQSVNTVNQESSLSINSLSLLGELSDSEKQWIGDRIYQNECASKVENLTYWGKGEDFPSFGIGHFIWFPAGVQTNFHETFPDMVRYVSNFKPPPQWVIDLSPMHSPWPNKQLFDSARSSEQLNELRTWLYETKSYQSEFIIKQFLQRFSNALDDNLVVRDKQYYIQLVEILLSFKKGRFAVIDYVNFKGLGNSKEQYKGQQWGLLSVLDSMNFNIGLLKNMPREDILDKFIFSAKSRLALRVQLAPKSRNEQRWLKGWFVRLDGYRLD